MSNISSTTLFHFLDKKEWLVEIIENLKLYPRYVLEDFPTFNEKYLIPMKCFCDIPLSNVGRHIETYGKFGIGLSKEFAFRNNISPVQYFHRFSDPIYALMSIDFKSENDFKFMIPYFKYMYSVDETSFYYNEREWRYVYRDLINVTTYSDSEIETLKYEKNLNFNSCENSKIDILLSDIEYIIVESNSNMIEIINVIEKLNLERIDKSILISKLLTIQQITNDF